MNLLNILVIGGIGYMVGKSAGENRIKLSQAITLDATLVGLEGSTSKTLTLTEDVPQTVTIGAYKIIISASKVKNVPTKAVPTPSQGIFVNAAVVDEAGNIAEFAEMVNPQTGLNVELGTDVLMLELPKSVTPPQ